MKMQVSEKEYDAIFLRADIGDKVKEREEMNDMELQSIINKYGTPTYLFDLLKLRERISLLREGLPKDTALCFAMKANPFLTGSLADKVDRLEVCSPGEYEICIKERINPEQIIVSGVNKTKESMERILSYSKGAGIYTIESERHYHILKACAREQGLTLMVMPRLSSGNQFGMGEETLERVVSWIQNDDCLKLAGIHYYSGTQKKAAKIESELSHLDELGNSLKARYNIDELQLEYGPGLMASYFEGEIEDETDYAGEQIKTLNDMLQKLSAYSLISIELGRFIASDCGYFATRIMDAKHTGDTNYIIADGGIHQLSYYGQMLGMKKPYMRVIEMENATSENVVAKSDKWTICGSLCTVNDILVRNVELPSFRVGDVIVFERCGAYSVTEGMALFLSRELPQVLLCEGDRLIKSLRDRKETYNLNS